MHTSHWRHKNVMASQITDHSSIDLAHYADQHQRGCQRFALLTLCEGNPPVTGTINFHIITPWYKYTWWVMSSENEPLWDGICSCFCRNYLCIKSLLVLQQIPLLSARGWPPTLSYGGLWSAAAIWTRQNQQQLYSTVMSVFFEYLRLFLPCRTDTTQ